MKKINTLTTWNLIAACHKSGSLTEAAEAAGMDLPAASRLIAALEVELNLMLLNRSRKPAAFTEALQILAQKAQRLTKAHNDLIVTARQLSESATESTPHRTIRISIPMNMSRQSIFKALLDYDEHHGGITLDICADSGVQSVIQGETDIALLGYEPKEEDLFVLPLIVNRNFLMVSAKYESIHGLPQRIQDLSSHRLLMRNRSNPSFRRVLYKGEETYTINPGQRVAYGDAITCRSMLLASEGIALDLDVGFMAAELANGTVKPVLPGWTSEPWKDCLVCRQTDSNDKLIRELMALIKKAAYTSFIERWDFWYHRFGIACSEEYKKL